MQNARRVPRMNRRTSTVAAALVAVAVAAFTAAAAGGSQHRASSPAFGTGRAESAPVQAAKATLKQLEQPVSRLEPNGPPFKAEPSAQGKTIGVVAGITTVPLYFQVINPFTEAAKLLGMKVKVCDGKGFQAAEITRCINL